MNFFAKCYSWGVTSENRLKIGVLQRGGSVSAKFSHRRERPPQSFSHGWIGQWMPYNSVADNFTQRNSVADFLQKHNKRSYCRDSAHRRSLHHSRSFKVTDVGTNRKPICNFLLLNNTNLHLIWTILQLLCSTGQILPLTKEGAFHKCTRSL